MWTYIQGKRLKLIGSFRFVLLWNLLSCTNTQIRIHPKPLKPFSNIEQSKMNLEIPGWTCNQSLHKMCDATAKTIACRGSQYKTHLILEKQFWLASKGKGRDLFELEGVRYIMPEKIKREPSESPGSLTTENRMVTSWEEDQELLCVLSLAALNGEEDRVY